MKMKYLLLVWIALMTMLLAACGSSPGDVQESSGTTESSLEASSTPLEATAETELPAQPVLVTPTIESNSNDTPPPPPSTEPFEVKLELEASDPAGVTLASGQVQLVEFFAFW
jgi:uncharacterized lipoprotein